MKGSTILKASTVIALPAVMAAANLACSAAPAAQPASPAADDSETPEAELQQEAATNASSEVVGSATPELAAVQQTDRDLVNADLLREAENSGLPANHVDIVIASSGSIVLDATGGNTCHVCHGADGRPTDALIDQGEDNHLGAASQTVFSGLPRTSNGIIDTNELRDTHIEQINAVASELRNGINPDDPASKLPIVFDPSVVQLLRVSIEGQDGLEEERLYIYTETENAQSWRWVASDAEIALVTGYGTNSDGQPTVNHTNPVTAGQYMQSLVSIQASIDSGAIEPQAVSTVVPPAASLTPESEQPPAPVQEVPPPSTPTAGNYPSDVFVGNASVTFGPVVTDDSAFENAIRMDNGGGISSGTFLGNTTFLVDSESPAEMTISASSTDNVNIEVKDGRNHIVTVNGEAFVKIEDQSAEVVLFVGGGSNTTMIPLTGNLSEGQKRDWNSGFFKKHIPENVTLNPSAELNTQDREEGPRSAIEMALGRPFKNGTESGRVA